MFAINMYSAHSARSYKEAQELLEKASKRKARTTWRGETCYPIPGKETSRQMSVREVKNGIAFQYHRTDVITWHPDNSYTIDTYSSRSTCAFFDTFAPWDTYLMRDGRVLIIDDLGYALDGSPCHVKDGIPKTGIGVFTKQVVNREGAKRVLAETRYAEYREWYKIMAPMLVPTKQPYFVPHEALEDEANWPMMASCSWGEGHPDKVRLSIYDANHRECYREETYDVLPREKARNTSHRVC